jgi:serine/threonine protein kinase
MPKSLSMITADLVEGLDTLDGRYVGMQRLRQPEDSHLSLIFQATDLSSSQSVVLKFLHPRLRSQYALDMLQREAQLLRDLGDNSYVIRLIQDVQITDIVVSGSDPPGEASQMCLRYITTERGQQPLSEFLRGAEREPRELLGLFRDICRAVMSLHQAGVYHRDIKPCNIVLFAGGRIKLIDFAFSYRVGSSPLAGDHEFHQVHGKPHMANSYSPPELHVGFGVNPLMYPKSDLFALGVLLWALCTGSNVFQRAYEDAVFLEIKELFARYVGETTRQAIYHKIMAGLRQHWRLPSLVECAPPQWSKAAPILDTLYRGLTEIDYRRRCDDFAWILAHIDEAITQLP